MITSISYSTDNGETWTTTNNQNNKSENLQITVNVNAGDKVLWKGTAQQTGYYDEEDMGDYVGSFFSSDCEFDVQGNVMSLCYGDNFIGQTTLNYEGQFACLFYDYYGNLECNVVNAKDLSLPATTLADYCYSNMFYGCTSLTTAPVLPAITLADSCYVFMFGSCTSLTSAPVLPATTLASSCYCNMFDGTNVLPDCSHIDFTSQTVVASGGLSGLFAGTNVTDNDLNSILPKNPNTNKYWLPVTTLANGCYRYMFTGCTSLTTAPELPATTLADECYRSMFNGCTSLTTAPSVLPATTLTQYCYVTMFNGCTSLTTAPVLPATTLTDYCYDSLFYGCSSLNYIKAMFTTTPISTYTQNWVSDVAATGTFVKNSAATWNVTGTSGIPSGWTVQTALSSAVVGFGAATAVCVTGVSKSFLGALSLFSDPLQKYIAFAMMSREISQFPSLF